MEYLGHLFQLYHVLCLILLFIIHHQTFLLYVLTGFSLLKFSWRGFQEQLYTMKPDEVIARSFELRSTTDQVAMHQCEGNRA